MNIQKKMVITDLKTWNKEKPINSQWYSIIFEKEKGKKRGNFFTEKYEPVSRDRILEFLKNHFQQETTTKDRPFSLSILKDFRGENLWGENVTV